MRLNRRAACYQITILFFTLCLSGCDESTSPLSSSDNNDNFDGPRLTIVNPEFDFGNVPQNSTVTHTFWLKSTGSTTLKILKIVPG